MPQELPHHLVVLKDTKRLREFLCNWQTLEELYDSELSTKLFSYWRQVSAIKRLFIS